MSFEKSRKFDTQKIRKFCFRFEFICVCQIRTLLCSIIILQVMNQLVTKYSNRSYNSGSVHKISMSLLLRYNDVVSKINIFLWLLRCWFCLLTEVLLFSNNNRRKHVKAGLSPALTQQADKKKERDKRERKM